MKRHLNNLVTAVAVLSVTLAASTALAGKGNGGGNGGSPFKAQTLASNSQSANRILSSNTDDKFKNIVTSNDLSKGNVLKLDNNIKKVGNGNTGIVKPVDLGIGNGSKNGNLKKLGDNNVVKNLKKDFCDPKDKCVPKDKCHDKCHDDWCKYHCWFPCWNYPVYDTCIETIYVEKPIVIETPVAVSTPVDLQLVSVKFGDVGDPASGLGPRYRITIRNASPTPVGQFKVVAVAVADGQPSPDAPPVFAVIDSLQAGEVKAFDVRLPVGALTLAHDAAGNVGPFTQLGVAVDADNQIPESNEENNRTILDRQQIAPISF